MTVPTDEGQRKLAQAHQIVVEALGRATALYGLPVALGRTYALLYLADMPLSVTEVTVRLGITKGTASVNLRVLERMQMVRQVWQPRRRGKFFVAERDFHRTLMALMRTTMAAELEIIRTGLAQSDRLLKEIESSADSSLRERARADQGKVATLGDYYETSFQLVQSLIEGIASSELPQPQKEEGIEQ